MEDPEWRAIKPNTISTVAQNTTYQEVEPQGFSQKKKKKHISQTRNASYDQSNKRGCEQELSKHKSKSSVTSVEAHCKVIIAVKRPSNSTEHSCKSKLIRTGKSANSKVRLKHDAYCSKEKSSQKNEHPCLLSIVKKPSLHASHALPIISLKQTR